MTRYVAFLGMGNIPKFLFEVVKETPTRLYGNVVELVDSQDIGWSYVLGYVHRNDYGKSYVNKGLTAEIKSRATWDQALPVMKHAIEQNKLEQDRLSKEKYKMQDRIFAAEVQAQLKCSEACLTELRKDA